MTRLARVILFSLLLNGCTEAPEHDLRAWMREVRQQSHAVPSELPAYPPLREFQYDAAGRIDPFDIGKISVSLSVDLNVPGLQPDTQRAREPLESFPLDSLRLVGSLSRRGQVVALVEADKLVHQVGIGSHLGPDMGKVVAINDRVIEIEELVQESGNRWTKRRVRLVLQENR